MSGPLLGSLNLKQEVLLPPSGSARRRRYIEEAEMFNIEVSQPSSLNCSGSQRANLSLPPPGFAGCGLFRSSLPRPRTYSEISPDLHEYSKSKRQQNSFKSGQSETLTSCWLWDSNTTTSQSPKFLRKPEFRRDPGWNVHSLRPFWQLNQQKQSPRDISMQDG